jgi:hypothetical protein
MAFTNTPVGPALATAFSRSYDIIAAADADTADTITHNLGIVPLEVIITPISAKGITGLWSLTSVSSTQIVLAKSNVGAGSGDPAAQVRVTLRFPHSRIQ